MHSAWTLNTLPPQNPVPHLSHISIPAHMVPTVGGIQTSVGGQAVGGGASVVAGNSSSVGASGGSSGGGNSDPSQEDKRRRMAEHERLVAAAADRDSREREREREREKELERLRQQEQQRAYYLQSGVQRAQTKSASDYHRGISIAPPPKTRREEEKPSPMKDLNTHQPFTLYTPKPNAPRHLKKAWLQRHTGEDLEDSTGITGGGSCVKLPLTLNTTPIANNSDQAERPPKSPPKRKPIKVKRRKGGARRHADESKKKR
uniref:Uncharacterized protein n=1 Tax=Phlebotomus papatasi TaxID=29031 RepID=A0A1B0DQ77_PHLPP